MKMRTSCKPTSVLNVTPTGLSHICMNRSIAPVTQGFISLVCVSSTHIQVYVEPANLLLSTTRISLKPIIVPKILQEGSV